MAETSDTHILEPATILSGATQESGVVDDLRREASQTACRTLSAQEGISLNDSNRVVNPGVAFPSSMLAVLTDVTETNIDKWLDTDSLAWRKSMTAEWFELTLSIDGWEVEWREVSLVLIRRDGEYPQHVHRHSDALFVAHEGQAYFLSWREETLINPGDVVRVPRGMLHGFRLIPMQGGEGFAPFSFTSIQYPPIRKVLPDGTFRDDLEFPTLDWESKPLRLNAFT